MFHNTIIQVENVHHTVHKGAQWAPILNGVSFTVEAGSWLAITGPAGSGKSTLLGILAGLDRPSSGRVIVEGADLPDLLAGRLARPCHEKIGVIYQSFHLVPTWTVLENVAAPLCASPQSHLSHSLAMKMLTRVGLTGRIGASPPQLTACERQRVAIARALVCGPEILLADEPTGGLDPVSAGEILDLIQELRIRLGLTVIMATRDPLVAVRADRHLSLGNGRVFAPALFPLLATPQANCVTIQ